MTESLWEKSGATRFPVQLSDLSPTELTFEGLDPALEVMVSLFAAAIRAEFADSWTTICASLPVGAVLRNSTDPVKTIFKIEPNPRTLGEIRVGWPLLALHRTGDGEFSDLTVHKEIFTQKWRLHWVLGPLTAGEVHKLVQSMQAVGKLIHRVVRKRSHPNHQNGTLQFGDGYGDLCWVSVAGFESGAARISEDDEKSYYALQVNLVTSETVDSIADPEPFLGADCSFNNGGPEGVWPGSVQMSTDAPNG